MSIQSDIEMLSIQAMETYAKRNHITGEEAINIFYRYQVFEKIMIQHEYLHQVGFEEVMNYVCLLYTSSVSCFLRKNSEGIFRMSSTM